MAGNCSHSVINAQGINMARTKRTSRKSTSGAPMLSQNEARRVAVMRAEARCRGGQEPRTDAKKPRRYRPGTVAMGHQEIPEINRAANKKGTIRSLS